MRVKDIISSIPVYETNHHVDDTLSIDIIEIDHRKLKKNSMFVCMRGSKVDGHTFVKEAIQNGATVIVSEERLQIKDALLIIVPDTIRALAMIAAKFYHYPTLDLSLVGITGTNGKTTTTYILEKIYKTYQQKVGVIGTIQVKMNDQVFNTVNTTPDSLSLQRMFSVMIDKGIDIAIMEVSSHALQLGRVYGCDLDVAVFTNLSQDHLDFHENMEQYAQAKALLFSGLGNSYSEKGKYAVINIDDTECKRMIKETNQTIITYGLDKSADVSAKEIIYTAEKTTFTLVTSHGHINVSSKMIGTFNMYNMLAATTVALTQKIDLETIKYALEGTIDVAGRFEQIRKGQNFTVIIDYAHTPESLQNVLEAVQVFTTKKVYVVVGAGGDRDRTKRPLMGQVATQYSDRVIFTTDNPRQESPRSIIDDLTLLLNKNDYDLILDRKEAIEYAINRATDGDLVMIAGKGHETYQEIKGVKYPFDDRIVAGEAIEKAIEQRGL